MSKSEFVTIKEPLGRAVFEAWYFQKLREEQERRKTKIEAEEAQIQKHKEEEEEKKEKALHEYTHWLEEKKLAYRKSLRRKQRKDTNKEKENEERLAKIQKAEAEWKSKKLKEKLKADKKAAKIAQKKLAEKEKSEKKKEESNKQFAKWQETIADKLKVILGPICFKLNNLQLALLGNSPLNIGCDILVLIKFSRKYANLVNFVFVLRCP